MREARVAPRLVIAAQRLRTVAVARNDQQILLREVAADAVPPQRRGKIERRSPHPLPEKPGGS